MSTFVIGDIHGGYKALVQVIERSNIKPGDTIIQLGDIVDGWDQVFQCVEYLLELKEQYNMIFIKGNHDAWFHYFIKHNEHPISWLHGGDGTLKSYIKSLSSDGEFFVQTDDSGYSTNLSFMDIPFKHKELFKNQLPYYVDKNNLFVHGGFNRHKLIEHQNISNMMWDRDLWTAAIGFSLMSPNTTFAKPDFRNKNKFKEIFIGHTSTLSWHTDKPMNICNIWNMDTGCAYNGKLSMMNVDTKELFQSDFVQDLYKDSVGRNYK